MSTNRRNAAATGSGRSGAHARSPVQVETKEPLADRPGGLRRPVNTPDSASEEFDHERVRRAATNPLHWRVEGEGLLAASLVLRAEWLARPHATGARLALPALLLAGYAGENCAKANSTSWNWRRTGSTNSPEVEATTLSGSSAKPAQPSMIPTENSYAGSDASSSGLRAIPRRRMSAATQRMSRGRGRSTTATSIASK